MPMRPMTLHTRKCSHSNARMFFSSVPSMTVHSIAPMRKSNAARRSIFRTIIAVVQPRARCEASENGNVTPEMKRNSGKMQS